ncbi:hypothetical protein TrispH2_002978 [Trichoplax sp. H2]|nr:hypothetical protein TrispH2_002978 [Trichoplax sp. H2]|eukprot:RDD45119.1 hypothetical protein TrispH2_002978 [Trichoplax sp. H2]
MATVNDDDTSNLAVNGLTTILVEPSSKMAQQESTKIHANCSIKKKEKDPESFPANTKGSPHPTSRYSTFLFNLPTNFAQNVNKFQSACPPSDSYLV